MFKACSLTNIILKLIISLLFLQMLSNWHSPIKIQRENNKHFCKVVSYFANTYGLPNIDFTFPPQVLEEVVLFAVSTHIRIRTFHGDWTLVEK